MECVLHGKIYLITKAWCTQSIKMTVMKKYQEMQPCHYSEHSNIHDPFSNLIIIQESQYSDPLGIYDH